MTVLVELEKLKEIISEVVRSELQNYNSLLKDTAKPIEDRLINFKELQLLIKLSRPTIFKKIKDGSIPVVRIGRRILFNREQVLKKIEEANIKK